MSDAPLFVNSVLEGNPLNRNVFLILILVGIIILLKREIDWYTVFKKNKCIWLYFLFGAISFFWSDFPYISFKRWIKASGVLIMAMIIVTDARPYWSIGIVIKRLSFILLPLSVLFIKYYPELGRTYHFGIPLYTGISPTKNSLGALCLISGIYYSWSLLYESRSKNNPNFQLPSFIYIIMIPMIVWLFYMANSATSLASMLSALCLFILARHPMFDREPRKIISFGIGGTFLFVLMEYAFNLKDTIVVMLGREPDLTTRVPMWDDLMSMVGNPLLGAGYESFWLGERLKIIQQHWGDLIQAHNGYLEMYLNMGIIGLVFILCWMISGIINVRDHLLIDYPAAILRLCFIVVAALYNYTEATFYGVSTIWMLFFIGVIYAPGQSMPYKQNK